MATFSGRSQRIKDDQGHSATLHSHSPAARHWHGPKMPLSSKRINATLPTIGGCLYMTTVRHQLSGKYTFGTKLGLKHCYWHLSIDLHQCRHLVDWHHERVTVTSMKVLRQRPLNYSQASSYSHLSQDLSAPPR